MRKGPEQSILSSGFRCQFPKALGLGLRPGYELKEKTVKHMRTKQSLLRPCVPWSQHPIHKLLDSCTRIMMRIREKPDSTVDAILSMHQSSAMHLPTSMTRHMMFWFQKPPSKGDLSESTSSQSLKEAFLCDIEIPYACRAIPSNRTKTPDPPLHYPSTRSKALTNSISITTDFAQTMTTTAAVGLVLLLLLVPLQMMMAFFLLFFSLYN